ncbi:unnamed protein product, partial [marine sediment metagenome]
PVKYFSARDCNVSGKVAGISIICPDPVMKKMILSLYLLKD